MVVGCCCCGYCGWCCVVGGCVDDVEARSLRDWWVTDYTAASFFLNCRIRVLVGPTRRQALRVIPPEPTQKLPPLILYVRWVGVGLERHCKTCRSLHELDH